MPAHDFPFHHGSIALSFAGTVGRRGSTDSFERIPGPGELRAWLTAAGLLPRKRLPIDESLYRRGIELREAVWSVAEALTGGRKPARAAVEVLNDSARRWAPVPRLDPSSLRLEGAEGSDPVRTALGRIAADAVDLFGDARRRGRLRVCEDGACSAVFLDPGRGRPRRWCSMARCGNRAKVAAFRARQKATV